MPEILSMIQIQKNKPALAMIIVALLLLIYLSSSNIYALINYTGFACPLWLRVTKPDWEGSIKVNIVFPVIYVLATLFITIVPMIVTPVETAIGLGIIATGIPVYFVFVYTKNRP